MLPEIWLGFRGANDADGVAVDAVVDVDIDIGGGGVDREAARDAVKSWLGRSDVDDDDDVTDAAAAAHAGGGGDVALVMA